ncbi:MAG: methyltransferase domain-containing protein, partial [Byssovorax sp.]
QMSNATQISTAQPHSALYLTDLRNDVWHDDYLDLLARRLDLAQVRSLLDVGCGLGHWGRRWYSRLAPGASYTGVDLEPQWILGAREGFAQKFPEAAGRAQFMEGSATSLPFADGELDAVTCQTVLMHLNEPERAIAEMVRVVRPGGLIFCAEPNSFHNYFTWNDAFATRPAEEIACVAEFWARCLRGRKAQGSGDETIGDRLPSLFTAAGLEDVQVRKSDCVLSFSPPYNPSASAWLHWAKEARTAGAGQWDEKKMRSRVLTGGGDSAFFDKAFATLHAWAEDDEARVRANTYSASLGLVLFLVSGRKPSLAP